MGTNQNIKKVIKDRRKDNLNKNIIIAIIKINNNNYKQRIINSYENFKSENFLIVKGIENEKEIKESEIFINDKKINFTYYYNFPKEGNYTIKYVFKKLLTSTNFMFFLCNSLLSLDLSMFNTKNVTDMGYMFYRCSYLISIDLSNFYTQNVKNMNYMFNC